MRGLAGGTAGLASALTLAACHTMGVVPPAKLAGAPPARVWVTLADRSTVVVESPQLSGGGDTLSGIVYGEPAQYPVSDTRAIRALQPAPLRTVAVAVLTSAAALAALSYFENRPDVGNGVICYGPRGMIVTCPDPL